MVDTKPLLSESEPANEKPCPIPKLRNEFRTLDDIIEEKFGDFGWAQLLQCILVSMARLFDAQQSFIGIYTDAVPTWLCIDSATCNASSDLCQLSKSAWTWDGSSSKTIVSEWGLECSGSFIMSLPSSSFFMGAFLGSFFLATLADSSLGRKKLLFISCLLMSCAALATIFSTNVWVYSALRFISGLGRSSIGTCVLLLLTEKVGKKWRGRLGVMGFFFFTLGYLSLPAVAYVHRDSSWRLLYFSTSIPAILYCILVSVFVSESPRWLFVQGREGEAMAILKKISQGEDTKSLNLCLLRLAQNVQSSTKLNPYTPFKCLFQKRWALKRLLAVMVLGLGIGMVYYGIPMGVQNLGFDIYLSVVLNASLEIPSSFVTFFLIDRCYRRTSILGFCLASGICSILCFAFVDINGPEAEAIKIGMEMTSLFGACVAYNILLIYTTELFPTAVRNAATSMARQAVGFSAVLSPQLASAGRRNAIFSYGVFGFLIISCSIFVAFLPETKDAALCDTMDEQEVSGVIS